MMAITENRLHHMLGVARYMYAHALGRGASEDEARDMFVLGFLHDIGYEWDDSEDHGAVAYEILEKTNYAHSLAVKEHGSSNPSLLGLTYVLRLLNEADMHIGPDGTPMTVEERLVDIGARYGLESEQYKNAVIVSQQFC